MDKTSLAGEIKSNLPKLAAAFYVLSKKEQAKAISAATNRTGDMVYTRVARILADETGVQQKRIRTILRKIKAKASGRGFEIYARDAFTSLKDFRPVARKAGIAASPWGKQRAFHGTFFGPGGHVFTRLPSTGLGRGKIKKLFGPAIPREMIRGASAKATNEVVADVFPTRLKHELSRAIEHVRPGGI